jgi:hypothetical protein
MRGSKAKKLRRLVFGEGFHWPTVKKNEGLRRHYRKFKAASGGKKAQRTIRQAIHKMKSKAKV